MKYKFEWYLDIHGHDGRREIEVEDTSYEAALQQVYDSIVDNIVIDEGVEVK